MGQPLMTITETARKNHEALFPGHQSQLQKTDPEFIALFDNFAFDEVLQSDLVEPKTRVMAILASLVAQQCLREFEVMLGAAWNAGVTAVEIKEIVYQAVPYLGIGKVFDFLHATNDFLSAKGVTLPLEGQATTTRQTRHGAGMALQKAVFGARIDEMIAQSPPEQLHIQHLLSANCFGDYYTRGGLDMKIRELLTFVLLLSLGGCEPQLKGHIQGNLTIGNGKDFLLAVITQLLPFTGYPRTLNAIACLNAVAG